jgi:hypothetical protein
MSAIKDNSKSKIVDYILDIDKNHSLREFYAVIFNLSNMLERNKNDYQINVAINILFDLNRKNKNKIFVLDNKDIVIIFEASNRDFVDKMIFQLRYLFIDDQIAFKKPNIENPNFAKVFVLAFQKLEFLSLFEEKTVKQAKYTESNANKIFETISQDIENLKLTNLIRNRSSAIIVPHKPINNIFTEYYISISQLKEILELDINLYSNKILYQFIKNKINTKLLETIKDNLPLFIQGPTNINLDSENILSDYFVDFHKSLKSVSNATVIVDFDIEDIFLDITAFTYAHNFLKELGYKICIDGLDCDNITHINPETFGADLIKIRYSEENDNSINQSILKKYISKFSKNRTILTHCHNKKSLEFGTEVGFYLFQGLAIEKKLNFHLT